ncbi:hypothetical protein ACPCXD_07750 [Rhodococcus sp. AB351]|uniref:hypothetical protein n=1 Tax=Rhodococcus sp. AB351 TaxID=3413280 RepID=UPI003C1B4D89
MSTADSRARAERVYFRRVAGQSWRTIMHEEGYGSIGAVQSAYKRHRARNPRDDADVTLDEVLTRRKIVTSQTFVLMQRAYEAGDVDAYSKLAAIASREDIELAKLYGLHAPDRHTIDVAVSQTPTAILARAEADLLAAFEARQQTAIEGEVVQ